MSSSGALKFSRGFFSTLSFTAVAAGVCAQGADVPTRARAEPGELHQQPARTPTAVKPGYDAGVAFGDGKNPFTGNAAAIADGRRFFTQYNCGGCHGTYGEGGMGPNLRGGEGHGGHDEAALFAAIMEGRPKGMPAWGPALPKETIWKIVAYLRVLGTSQEPGKPSGS